MCVCLHVCICDVCVGVNGSQKKASHSPGTRVLGGCELLYVGAGN